MQELKENQGIPRPLLLILSVVSGLAVANNYYSQPLLSAIAQNLHISELAANHIPMMSQIGYACGLLFIIPLGDLYRRRKIILVDFILLIAALLVFASAQHVYIVYAAALVTGICTVIPQIFIPIVAQFSEPINKSRNVGLVLSGLLTGILASRVVSGIVGEYFGWRMIFYISAVLMVFCFIIIYFTLPDIPSSFKGRYSELLRSILTLVRKHPNLRVSSIRAGLGFGSLLAMWASLTFKMVKAPFFASQDIIGLLGLCGVAGALAASVAGKYTDRLGTRKMNYIGSGAILLAWLVMFFAQNSYIGMVFGIIVIDMGIQLIQVSNQSHVLIIDPKASNRLNTVFMTTFFIGGAFGTFLSGLSWNQWMWNGVVMAGIGLALAGLLLTVLTKE